jgi:hypothetical protein
VLRTVLVHAVDQIRGGDHVRRDAGPGRPDADSGHSPGTDTDHVPETA